MQSTHCAIRSDPLRAAKPHFTQNEFQWRSQMIEYQQLKAIIVMKTTVTTYSTVNPFQKRKKAKKKNNMWQQLTMQK